MAGLPRFPISGAILSNNVAADRFTLITNTVGSSAFPAGQYVFYTKNASVWYKYKTTTTPWTSELLYIGAASQPNTKFDQNGFPVTGYVDSQGLVKVNYYTGGTLNTATVAISGSLPTVIQTPEDTYLFWVPANYSGNINWAQLCSSFSVNHPYPINIPGTISSMQIQNAAKNTLVFSFTIDNGSGRKVYVAFTDPARKMVTYDLQAMLNFVQGTFLDPEDFIIAEDGQGSTLSEAIVGSPKPTDSFRIADSAVNPQLTLIKNQATLSPEYFIISQQTDMEIITQVIVAQKFRDMMSVAEMPPSFGLVFIPDNKFGENEYFVVSEVVNAENSTIAVQAQVLGLEPFSLKESTPTFQSTNVAPVVETINEELIFADISSGFLLTNYQIPVQPPKTVESFVLDEEAYTFTLPLTAAVLGFDLNDDDTPNHFRIYLDDTLPEYFLLDAVFFANGKLDEGFIIGEANNSFLLTALIDAKFNNNPLVISDSEGVNYAEAIAILTSHSMESLQLHESSNTILLYTDISLKNYEFFNVNFENSIYSQTVSKNTGKLHDAFMIKEGIQTETYSPGISFKILQDVTAPYQYKVPKPVLKEVPLITFLSYNNNIPSYYYFLDTSNFASYQGPKTYDINVVEPSVSYILSRIT